MIIPLPSTFWSKVEKTESCWLWTGYQIWNGYGMTMSGSRTDGTRRMRLVHRLAYENVKEEEIPAGLDIDHLCRVRLCVNPDHLEPVTRSENIRRVPPKTYCKYGHSLEDAYLLRTGKRRCRQCSHRLYEQRKAKERAS